MVVYYTGVNNSKLHSRFNLFSMIVNDKTPNKHFFNSAHSFTFDDQKNDWQELSHNFYFLEDDDAKIYYFNGEDGKNYFYDSNE